VRRRFHICLLLLALWAPAQAISGVGSTALYSHPHEASLSERGQIILHHHSLDAGSPARSDYSLDFVSHDHSEGADHVVHFLEPARRSSSHESMVRELAAHQAAPSPLFVIAIPSLRNDVVPSQRIACAIPQLDRRTVLLL
jgi:hypothetical protein